MASALQLTVPSETSRHCRTLTAWPDRESQKTTTDLRERRRRHRQRDRAVRARDNVMSAAEYRSRKKAPVQRGRDSRMPVDELRVRDLGPVYARSTHDRTIVGLDLNFNYWGNKYDGTMDQNVAQSVLQAQSIARVPSPLVLEGGALEFDGEDILLATENSIVNDNRNPGKSQSQIELGLKDLFGVNKVVWFRGVRGQDVTDCHVDALARFRGPGEIILSRPHPAADRISIDVYNDAKQVLQSATDARGRRFQIHEVEEANLTLFDGYDLVLSYLNYALVNGGVVIPAFGDEDADAHAVQQFQDLFPERRVVQVRLCGLLRLGEGIHCAMQHQPLESAV